MDGLKITPETEVSTTELACVLGITGRCIRQLAEDGQLEKVSKGRFLLCDSVQRYFALKSYVILSNGILHLNPRRQRTMMSKNWKRHGAPPK